MFDLNQLRCFVAVAEELHFGRAAVRLHMTQPPLSRQIQLLERILDVTLLERTSRSVRLTATGRMFLPEAKLVIRMAEAAADMAKRVDSGKAGSLKVVFTAASAYSYLPALVAASMTSLADVDLSLGEMVTGEQIEALITGRADIGLMRPPIAREELACECVQTEALLAAVHVDHPLARASSVCLADFDAAPFIMYSAHEARYFHDTLISMFAAGRMLPRFVQHLSQIHSILALVKSGLGSAIVPASAANLRYEGVVLRPLDLAQPHAVELHMVWRRNHENPAVERMLQAARSL